MKYLVLASFLFSAHAYASGCPSLKVGTKTVSFVDDQIEIHSAPGHSKKIEIEETQSPTCKALKITAVKTGHQFVELTFENAGQGTKVISTDTYFVLVDIEKEELASEPITIHEEQINSDGDLPPVGKHLKWTTKKSGPVLEAIDNDDPKDVTQVWPPLEPLSKPTPTPTPDPSRKPPAGISTID